MFNRGKRVKNGSLDHAFENLGRMARGEGRVLLERVLFNAGPHPRLRSLRPGDGSVDLTQVFMSAAASVPPESFEAIGR
jgi:hypothetical protein